MPAKKRDETRFKPFVGRVFTLRQHKDIPCFHNNKERIEVKLADFGEAVLVTDENNTRVKVTLSTGSFVWIPKFFLHKEIKSALFRDVDGISECIRELLDMAENMRVSGRDFEPFLNYADGLERVVSMLRQYTDENSPTNNKSKKWSKKA